MKPSLWTPLLLPLSFAAALPSGSPQEDKVDYSGYKLLRVSLPENAAQVEEQIEALAAHVMNPGNLQQWDVVVSPDNVARLGELALNTEVVNEDVGAAIAEEGDFATQAEDGDISTQAVPNANWFTAYHSFADHQQFLRDLQSSFTGNSEIVNTGTSVQGRPLDGIHIWGSGGKGSRPAVLFHGTVHAREWITTMTVEYMAYQLLTRYGSDAAVRAVVNKFDLYIFPVVNPDGFVYSQTTDRLWRKNRQTVSTSSCIGRDQNRNWPYKWEVPGGASTNPCSETYKGQQPGDSPEIRGMTAYVNRLRDATGLRLYIDFHSYGQYILWPYGYDCSIRAENDAQMNTLAQRASSAIAGVSGTRYTIGSACSTLYATTGDSTDYTDVVGNATYSYTYELRDTGNYGFSLPANQIQPTVVETWQGVLSMLQGA